MLFSMIGCSDTPYTGQVLTVDDMVNRYLVSTENTACLYNGVESSCLTLRPPRTGGVASNAPIIHVHPRKLIYTFYYEGKQIVHAERVIDTTEIVAALQSQTQTNDQSGANNPPPPPPPPPPPVVRRSPPPPPPPPVVRNPPPNNGGNNGGGNNGGTQQPVTRTATTLEVFSGNGQSAETDRHLTNPLIVKVLDQNSAALSGIIVSFSVNPSGTLNPTSATTDADGQASTALQFGSTAGAYTVTASVSGLPSVTFTATATDPPRSETLEKISGDDQSKEAYQHLPDPLVVEVLDQYGAPLPDATVSFTVTPSVGVLSPASATTGSNGEASTILRFGKTTGAYTVTVTAIGINQSVTFTATATARPVGSDWAQESHYYDADQSKQGWLVWIYYPANYKGPRGTAEGSADADFLINGFMLIPEDGATVTEFSQTEVDCWDPDKPCNSLGPGDPEKQGVPTTYSVQIFLATTQDQTSIQVIWDRKAGNWSDGSPPPDMTYNLMSSKNMMTFDQDGYDPDHTNQ